VTERHYALLAVLLPGLALAAIAGYAAGAGCYAIYMNCFSVVVPDDSLTRAMFFAAAFVPFGAPSYAPVAASGLAVLRRGGARAVERWSWAVPLPYAAIVHASCLVFASAVLPERRIHPDLRFDVLVVAGGYAYVALVRLAKRALVRAPRVRWGIDPTRAS
jgi:hypothetical protein